MSKDSTRQTILKDLTWDQRLGLLYDYVSKNYQMPSTTNPEFFYLAQWAQQTAYKMKNNKLNDDRKQKWGNFCEEYQKIKLSNKQTWFKNMEEVKQYIEKNKQVPSINDDDEQIQNLGIWINQQAQLYESKTSIMNNEDIKQKWKQFNKQYEHLLILNDDQYYQKLHEVEQYINQNKQLPPHNQRDEIDNQDEIKIESKIEELMKMSVEIDLFQDSEENNKQQNVIDLWEDNYATFQQGVQKERETRQLGLWVHKQIKQYLNYKQTTHEIKTPLQLQKESNMKKWQLFIEKYRDLFILSNEDQWNRRFNKLVKYIQSNDERLPQPTDGDLGKKLANYIRLWNHYYYQGSKIMTNENVKNKWKEFREKYGLSLDQCESEWIKKLQQAKEYMDTNERSQTKIDNEDLRKWLSRQNYNYDKKINLMKNDDIRKVWEDFKSNYKCLLFNQCEIRWREKLQQLQNYMKEHTGQFPSQRDESPRIRKLALWVADQDSTKNPKSFINKREDIKEQWIAFKKESEQIFKKTSNAEHSELRSNAVTIDMWKQKLDELQTYIQSRNKIPSGKMKYTLPSEEEKDLNKIKSLGIWVLKQNVRLKQQSNNPLEQEKRKIWMLFKLQNISLFKSLKVDQVYRVLTHKEIVENNCEAAIQKLIKQTN